MTLRDYKHRDARAYRGEPVTLWAVTRACQLVLGIALVCLVMVVLP